MCVKLARAMQSTEHSIPILLESHRPNQDLQSAVGERARAPEEMGGSEVHHSLVLEVRWARLEKSVT